jgi:hypothetical protein
MMMEYLQMWRAKRGFGIPGQKAAMQKAAMWNYRWLGALGGRILV